MKWNNKGHEFDDRKAFLGRIISDGLCIFGTGIKAQDVCKSYLLDEMIFGYIDNDENKQGNFFQGKKIISFEEYSKNVIKRVIILALNKKNEAEVIKQLDRHGLISGIDYMTYEVFFRDYYAPLLLFCKNIIYVELVQISLTERCSLKCKKCAHGCFAVSPNQADMSIDLVKSSADCFFGMVDHVKYFVLIGGEPLLYRGIEEVISYVGDRYRDRIENFQITTNGTIMPTKKMLELCKKYDINFVVSNYTKSVPWIKPKIEKIRKELDESQIRYEVFSEETLWMDYGFDHINQYKSGDEMIRVFDRCRTDCHEIRGSKLYFCVMARSVSDNLFDGEIGQEDYLELAEMNPQKEYDRRVFLEYLMGYSEKGYLDMCARCNGADSYKYVIPAAEQVN